MKSTRFLTTFMITLLFYILFTGLLNELTLFSGTVIALATAVIVEKLNIVKWHPDFGDFNKIVYVFKYTLYFITSEVIEHLRVTKLILGREVSLNPAVVEVPIDVKSDVALTVIALTITNTPGTIAVDVDKERGVLYVHLLNQEVFEPEEVKRRVLGDLEDLVKGMVGEK